MCKVAEKTASMELEKLKISYRDTPYDELPKEGDKRVYLMSLTQKQIQNSDNPAHIFLPIPRAEVIYRKLRMIEDKNNIAQYGKGGNND